MGKKIKYIMLILVSLLIVLIMFYILYIYNNREEIKAQKNLEFINNSEKWDYEVKFPNRASNIKNVYEGDLSIKDIGKSMYYFTTQVLPKYYLQFKNSSEEDIVSYFNENSKIIAIDIGVENQDDFIEIIESIQNLNSGSLTLESFRIDKDFIKAKSDYTETVLYITYQGNEEIGFDVKINNKIKENSSSIEYTALKD